MPSSTMTTKGQITIPKAVRETLQIAPGDRVAFRIQPDGTVIVEAETEDLLGLQGALQPQVRGVSIDDMNAAIREAAAGE
jgi:antitoxin PrlF